MACRSHVPSGRRGGASGPLDDGVRSGHENERVTRRRGTWLGAGLLACAFLALGFWWRRAASEPEVPSDAWRRVPAEARVVLRVQWPEVSRSEAWQRWVVDQGGARGLQRLRGRCGFDPFQGVEEVVLWRGVAPGPLLEGLAVQFRGRLPVERLADCMRRALRFDGQAEVREVRLEGHRALQSLSGRSSAVAVGSSLLVLGATTQVRAALQTLRRPERSARAQWPVPWNRILPGSPIRWVLHLPAEPPSWWPEVLGGVRWVFGGLRLGPPVALRMRVRFDSADASRRAYGAWRALRARLVRGVTKGGGGAWGEPLAALRLRRDGTELVVSGLWGLAELERLFASLASVSVGAGEEELGAEGAKLHGSRSGPGGALPVPEKGAGHIESFDPATEHEHTGEPPGGG